MESNLVSDVQSYSNSLEEEDDFNHDVQSFSNSLEEEDDLLEDYAECWWTNGFPEILYPSWLDSIKETISDDKLLKDV